MEPEAPGRALTAVDLHPLGGLSADRARAIASRLSRRIDAPCRIAERTTWPAPLLPGREQGDADAVLAALESRASPEALSLGVTAEDLAIPIFTFVFGRARSGGRAALISLARLDPVFYGLPADEDLLVRRAVFEALHELGHVARLGHCEQASCLMRFAGSVEKADLRGAEFCAECARVLPGWMRRAG